jgi:hypothetical protein
MGESSVSPAVPDRPASLSEQARSPMSSKFNVSCFVLTVILIPTAFRQPARVEFEIVLAAWWAVALSISDFMPDCCWWSVGAAIVLLLLMRGAKPYISWCFRCKRVVNSAMHPRCARCGWVICAGCGACGCDYRWF